MNYLEQSSSEAFDQDCGPGAAAPCHPEIGIAAGHVLPQGLQAHTLSLTINPNSVTSEVR
ncbi:hypothetical protein [Bradyrhizobium sp. DASA03120]|uniref:hypothetical protein n=1 Tax=Bradyrhizobium sp. SMVTL-02 TaxID=3395917 RepID=UPI003F703C32